MIRLFDLEPSYEVVPQAIFWRSLQFFTSRSRKGADDLDRFVGASFVIGNAIHFDLRTYAGHPWSTVTVYLPFDVIDLLNIDEMVNRIISEMLVPKTSIAWRRGERFRYGELSRPTDDRLREPEARILALKIAATQKDRAASTEFIKSQAPRYFDPSPIDLESSMSRSGENKWQQIVGNVVSHQATKRSLFSMGYAQRTDDGLRVTELGLSYLSSMGFVG